MGDEKVKKVLKGFGVTEKEAEVYIFVAKHGVLRSGEIVKNSKMHKADVYRILKSLQTKGLVESTLESPTRFIAVPFETVLDSLIKAKRDEAALIESTKQDLLSDWKNISQTSLEPPVEKFTVIEGNHKIYAKILQMTKESKQQLSAITTVPGLARADQFGVLDAAFNHPLKDKIQFRFLTDLSSQNLNALKTLLRRVPKIGFNFKGRNPDLGLQLSPRMVIRDDEEIIFFITPKTETATVEQDEVCLWTNCKALVQAFSSVFEDLWRNSTDIQKKTVEIETGQPTPKTYIIADAETAKKKYDETMRSAKEEITIMTSSEGLIELWKSMTLLKEWAERGISVKIMAPLVGENLKATQQLSKFCAVRHVSISYLRTTIIDGQHLFQFKTPPAGQEKSDILSHFENTFYSNDLEYVEKTKIMLNDIWKKAHMLFPVTPEPAISSPESSFVSPPDEKRIRAYRNIINYVGDAKFLGAGAEKDVLNKILNAKKIPFKNLSKDIIRYHGSAAFAIIRLPDQFNLPDMMIQIFHNDKQSSFGAEDWLVVNLWLETPKGHAFVPVAVVQDNPRSAAVRKAVLAGTPAGQNIQVVKKDELQVRIQGNTLFAGWTVPIRLLSSYTLPPCCVLFEGYGDLRTTISKTKFPSGRQQICEQNGFEAFVTFFHPASKYAGPGTEGLLFRDSVFTSLPPSAE